MTGLFGDWVAGTPDLNGDGRGDVLVGALNETAGGFAAAGHVHVFNGATRQLLYSLASPSPQVNGGFGLRTSSVPDITGDGVPEIVVGAPFETGPGSPAGAGRAYIFNGATGGYIRTLRSPHEQVTGSFGWEVSGIQDVNGDGRGDVIVGAVDEAPVGGPADTGRAYIFDGNTGNVIWELDSPNPNTTGRFGYAVSGVRDTDGDGRGDVIIGAYQEDAFGYTHSGHAYLFSGKTGSLIWDFTSRYPANDGRFGVSVSGVPDLSGDGRGDVVIGACCEVPPGLGFRAGNVYVFSGRTGNWFGFYSSPNPQPESQFGYSVSGVPDLDGDGLGDLIVGAIRETPAGFPSQSGRAYVYSGKFDGPLLHTLVSPNPEVAGNFGKSVGGIPDAGGDFRGDLIVGAYQEDPGASPVDSGRAYIFDGLTGGLTLHRNAVSNWALYE